MDGFEINLSGIKATGYTNNTSGARKADKLQGALPLVQTNAVKSDGLYEGMGLKFSPEARMAAEMEKSPFMNSLNELFGI